VVSIYVGVKGYLDKVSVKDVNKFEEQFLQKIKTAYPEILQSIAKEQKITESTESQLKQAIVDFLEIFLHQKS